MLPELSAELMGLTGSAHLGLLSTGVSGVPTTSRLLLPLFKGRKYFKIYPS